MPRGRKRDAGGANPAGNSSGGGGHAGNHHSSGGSGGGGSLGAVPADGSGSIDAAASFVSSLHEAVCAHAFGFEATILFSHAVSLLVMLHTLYRSRMPAWASPMVTATSCCLAKYVLMRPVFPAVEQRASGALRYFFKNKKLLAISVLVAGMLVVSLVQLSVLHSPTIVSYWLLPHLVSNLLFREMVPSLPGHRFLGVASGGTDRPRSAHLARLCLHTVLFRVVEGVYYSTVLPILLQEDRYIFYDHWCCALLIVYTCVNSTVLLAAETFVLNRLRLVFEARGLGYWASSKRKGQDKANPTDKVVAEGKDQPVPGPWRPDATYLPGSVVTHRGAQWEAVGAETVTAQPGDHWALVAWVCFANELGHPKSSRLLLCFATIQVLVMGSQLVLVLNSLQWVPYAALMVGTFGGMVLTNASTSGPQVDGGGGSVGVGGSDGARGLPAHGKPVSSAAPLEVRASLVSGGGSGG